MNRSDPKTYFLKTFGCQMNVYDSERMAEALARDGYRETADLAGADLVILNTCHIREKAAEKVYSELGRIRDTKTARAENGKSTVIAVAGCVAQAEGPEITARQPAVDLVIGPQSYHRLPELITRTTIERSHIVETEFPGDEKFARMKAPRRVSSPSAFLTIQEGCDKFCTFCVVPYTRGAEYSRSVAKIEAEARELAAAGAKELVLLGQNVNAYHGEGTGGRTASLADLIRALARIDGIERIRYMTSHPRDMSDDLIAAHVEVPQLMPFLHLPVQSGSDRILAKMNRKHSVAEYVDLIARVRKARPDIALSSDFIVGFPGESDQDAEDTIALIEAIAEYRQLQQRAAQAAAARKAATQLSKLSRPTPRPPAPTLPRTQPNYTAEQNANRNALSDAMEARGFNDYMFEWWHFVLANEPYPSTYFDFPIAPRD